MLTLQYVARSWYWANTPWRPSEQHCSGTEFSRAKNYKNVAMGRVRAASVPTLFDHHDFWHWKMTYRFVPKSKLPVWDNLWWRLGNHVDAADTLYISANAIRQGMCAEWHITQIKIKQQLIWHPQLDDKNGTYKVTQNLHYFQHFKYWWLGLLYSFPMMQTFPNTKLKFVVE